MAVDFGKQIGPLPLGAWVAVVGGGLGIAWYTMRGSSSPPVVVEDTSGTPGVGVGAPADWTPIQGTGSNTPQAPTTNEQWGQRAIQWLIAQNYPPTTSDSAVRKYLSGQGGLSVQETTLIGIVLVAIGPPPQTLPPTEGDETPTDPIPTGLRSTGQRKGATGGWISLQWTPVSGFSSYRVWGPSGATFWDVSGNKVSMDWWVPNVTATYSFSVSTKDGIKVGPRSAPISVTYTRK